MSAASFAGSHVAIVTPLRDSGEVDWQAWSRLVDFHLQQGSDGVVIGGTTGESVSLDDAELRELLLKAREQAGTRLRILAGVGTSSTATTVARARAFSTLPVDGLLLVTPAYNRPTQDGLYLHFEAAAAASRVPVMLYNVPSRTAVDLLPETVARLARLPNVVATKEAVPTLPRIRDLRAACPESFEILSGDDATAREALGAGACGVVTVTGNVAPALMRAMIEAARQGDATRAAQIDAQLAPLHQALFLEANPIPVKWALARMGLIGGTLRLPLTELSPRYRDAVAAALRAAQIPMSTAALMHKPRFARSRPFFTAGTLLLACLSLGACKHGPAACTKPGDYEGAESIAPLRIPSGLEAPDTRGALKIPELADSTQTLPPAGTCLDQPPRYAPNARLVAPEQDKKSKRRKGDAPAAAPATAPASPPPAAP